MLLITTSNYRKCNGVPVTRNSQPWFLKKTMMQLTVPDLGKASFVS